jgi:predicted nucleotidyltransferase
MEDYKDLLERFVQQNIDLLGDELVGIYLHGSAVMGCMNVKKSDLDLLIVVKNELANETKRKYQVYGYGSGAQQRSPGKGNRA